VAGLVRVAIGLVLVAVAPVSRFPIGLRVLGAIAFLGGLVTPLLGVPRARAIVDWWTAHGPAIMRVWSLVAVAIRIFVALSVMDRHGAGACPRGCAALQGGGRDELPRGVDVPDGKVTDMKRAVQAKPDETVVVGYITWPDRATRDAAWEKLMKDTRMSSMEMPFDGKRMIYGAFEIALDL